MTRIPLYKFELQAMSVSQEISVFILAKRIRGLSGRINELGHGLPVALITTWLAPVDADPFKWQNYNLDSTE